MLLLSSDSEYPPPQRPSRRPLCALLRLYRSRVGLTPTLVFLARLGRFSRLCAGVQFLAQLVALPFGLFAPTLLFRHPLVQCGLRHFAAGTFGAELFADSPNSPAGPGLSGDSRAPEESSGAGGFNTFICLRHVHDDCVTAADFLVSSGDHLP